MNNTEDILYLRLSWALSALSNHMEDRDQDQDHTTEIVGRTYYMYGGELHSSPMFEAGGYDAEAMQSVWEVLYDRTLGAEDAENLIKTINSWLDAPTYMEVT